MNLYRIHSTARGYDTYESAVVAAPDEETARKMHPSDGSVKGAPNKEKHHYNAWGERWDYRDQCVERVGYSSSSWISDPAKVAVELVGTAADGIAPGVVCASFRAG
jgi:hypothetical protein